MKIPKDFNKIPGSKILGNPVPKNPGIPGFGKIPSRKIPGLKFLIPLGPDYWPLNFVTYFIDFGNTYFPDDVSD